MLVSCEFKPVHKHENMKKHIHIYRFLFNSFKEFCAPVIWKKKGIQLVYWKMSFIAGFN